VHIKFDTLIQSFINDQVGVVEEFLTLQLAHDLRQNLLRLFAANEFHVAGIGNLVLSDINAAYRRDQIYWLDKSHHDIYEDQFFELMDQFVAYLNQYCYTGIRSYEFHYTFYEVGSFYKKHIDQFKNNDSRKYSMILYLNDNWQTGDGGELCVHHALRPMQNIEPHQGTSVFFDSKVLIHEVLTTHKPRLSITGWLKT
jgi:SM-20-related protein